MSKDKLVKIKTALISVSDKDGLEKLVQYLSKNNTRIISTGGTLKALKDAKVKAMEISEFTNFPEIMDGRVKTLHPKVHGGILARRNKDQKVMEENNISPIWVHNLIFAVAYVHHLWSLKIKNDCFIKQLSIIDELEPEVVKA